MTHFHYYATTAGKTDRILQYAIYPLSLGISFLAFKDKDKASRVAQVATALCSATMTSTFFGLEADMIDQDSYKAVAAEMGLSPDEVKFSDYGKSGNIIVKRAYEDLLKLQKGRYLTDALFVLPMVVDKLHNNIYSKNVFPSRDPSDKALDLEKIFRDVGPGLAGKSGYWAYETFLVEKTSHYEVVKIRENLESTGKAIKADDLLAVYQRARDDSGLHRIDLNDGEAYKAIMPLLERMADEYNKHDGKFGMGEIVYLMGLGKINIYAPDNKTISQEAIEKSYVELDKVLSVGLNGICEENKKRRELGLPLESSRYGQMRSRNEGGFVSGLVDGAFQGSQAMLAKMFPKRPEEYITRRDPSEVTTLASRNDNVNFIAGRT